MRTASLYGEYNSRCQEVAFLFGMEHVSEFDGNQSVADNRQIGVGN